MQELSRYLKGIYKKQVINEGLLTQNKGVPRFTLKRVAPKLRDELDKRILASASLIKMNKEARLQETLQRFAGWSTSIPAGGTDVAKKKDIKLNIGKALKSLPFDERRVIVDQGHKFNAGLNEILATDGGAIAAVWHSQWRRRNYNFRDTHKARDEKIYVIPGSWALEKGLIRQGLPSTDSITKPGEEVFCFPGDLKVPFANVVEKAYRRWYSGEFVTLTFESGRTLCATPNHPILTALGWRPIGALNVGDDVIEASEEAIQGFEKNQNDGGIPTIAEIFGTLEKNGIVESLKLSCASFHGDGSDSYVDIVRAARSLSIGRQPSRPKCGKQIRFPMANFSAFGVGAFHFCMRGVKHASAGFMRGVYKGAAVFGSRACHTQYTGVGTVAQFHARGFKALQDHAAANANSFRYGKKAFASLISGDNIGRITKQYNLFWNFFKNVKFVKPSIYSVLAHTKHSSDFLDAAPFGTQLAKIVGIKREFRSAHVYNLQTDKGWYVADRIICRNCSCYYEYIYSLEDLPSSMLTKKGLEAIKHAKQAYDGQA